MREIEANWECALIIWWSFIWRTVLMVVGFGFVLGFLAGIASAVFKNPNFTKLSILFSGYVFPLFASLVAIRMILRKKYKWFTIKIISNEATPETIRQQFSDVTDGE